MTNKSPPTRRKFNGPWDRADYLYHKLLYWLYERGLAAKAMPYARALEGILKRHYGGGSIFPEECLSLAHECKGDLAGAIEHRLIEVRLLKRHLEVAEQSVHRDTLLAQYGYSDLCDRLDLLATLYHDTGDVSQAVETLRESQSLCQRHCIDFDGKELIREYTNELGGQAVSRRKPA
jgi:hypothetical protein